jgi:hypothetical protein
MNPKKINFKNQRLIVPGVLLSFLGQMVCQARIGETLAQCIARWGQELPSTNEAEGLPDGTTGYVFQMDGCFITVAVLNLQKMAQKAIASRALTDFAANQANDDYQKGMKYLSAGYYDLAQMN